MTTGQRAGPRHYFGLGWESPPGDETGVPRCPECRRYYLQNKRKLVWSGFWFCNHCESINTTAGGFGNMKYESDHHSPEWPDRPEEYEFPDD